MKALKMVKLASAALVVIAAAATTMVTACSSNGSNSNSGPSLPDASTVTDAGTNSTPDTFAPGADASCVVEAGPGTDPLMTCSPYGCTPFDNSVIPANIPRL